MGLLKKSVLICLIGLTSISSSQPLPEELRELKLNQDQIKNLGSYIRSCEIEKEISMSRFDNLVECASRTSPDFGQTTSILVILTAFMAGALVGAQIK